MNDSADKQFEAMLVYLQQQRGFDFTGYKRPSLMRRVDKRMQSLQLQDFGDYYDYLQVHPGECALLFNPILTNVTSFFRDGAAWDFLAGEVLPQLLKHKPAGEPLRVWSAGCASGEEAYSVAMLFAEAMGIEGVRER